MLVVVSFFWQFGSDEPFGGTFLVVLGAVATTKSVATKSGHSFDFLPATDKNMSVNHATLFLASQLTPFLRYLRFG